MKDTIQELRYEKDEIMKLMSKSQAKKIAEKDAEKKGEAVAKKSSCSIS